jgi:hypothetical protein
MPRRGGSPPNCGLHPPPDRRCSCVLRNSADLDGQVGWLSREPQLHHISAESAFSEVLRSHPNGTSFSPTCTRRRRPSPAHAGRRGPDSETRPVPAGGHAARSSRDHAEFRVSPGHWAPGRACRALGGRSRQDPHTPGSSACLDAAGTQRYSLPCAIEALRWRPPAPHPRIRTFVANM